MKKNDLTFLDVDQIFGDKQLSVFKKRGTKAAITDFSILLGGYVDDYCYVNDSHSLKDRTGWYWVTTYDKDNDVCVVNSWGYENGCCVMRRDGGSRLVFSFSSITSESGTVGSIKDRISEIEYGYYPQTAVSKNMQKRLENIYRNGLLRSTGKNYITDARQYCDYNQNFRMRFHDEYEFENRRYVRVFANSCFDGKKFMLSNGEEYKDGDVVWIEVEPVKWLVDEEEKVMITEKLIFAGIQFDCENDNRSDFSRTNIKKFMDSYLSKDLFQNHNLNIDINVIQDVEVRQEKSMCKSNSYNFDFIKVSEEDIIKGAVQSDIAVFLHGRSSEGKSARVKQLDPDCEIIYLRNATPESLNGKSVYNSETGEMIDVKPTWLIKLEEKCEKEKDKIHILFFDEITNALPSIQGMAFNIVLDKEVNGKWQLPKNARIVAAGNDLNDSLAANTMAEPLFNRFAHVYINTTVESWLAWASTPKEKYKRLDYIDKEPEMKIHPAIYAYISYKASRGEDVLRTEYNGEKPNADPRKWEMASKMLYSTKSPEMLRALIGEDLTTDFTEFCKNQLITIEDVIKSNYTDRDLEMNIAEKFSTAAGLSVVDEKNLEVVREFVKKLGAEVLAVFDNLWIRGDEKRLERIAELRASLTKRRN